jgi:hypothetical protein
MRWRLPILSLPLLLVAPSLAHAQDGASLGNGTGNTINAWGVCFYVTNNSGQNQYVPLNAPDEWASFYNNYHPGIGLYGCVCNLPWGGQIAVGQSVYAYAWPQGCGCPYQLRSCVGYQALTGSYGYGGCNYYCGYYGGGGDGGGGDGGGGGY